MIVYNGQCSKTYPISVTITNRADSGIISGASTVCTGATTTLSEMVSGGSWSSSNTGIASIGSTGVVTGVATGNATISYSVTSGCGSSVSTKTTTVIASPNAGSITGAGSVCVSNSLGLTSTSTGGTWSSASSNLSISGSKLTGVPAGSDVISYSVINGCGTAVATATVNGVPGMGISYRVEVPNTLYSKEYQLNSNGVAGDCESERRCRQTFEHTDRNCI